MDAVSRWIPFQGRFQVPPDNPLLRSVSDKVLGRGRGRTVVEQVTSARVPGHTRPIADLGR